MSSKVNSKPNGKSLFRRIPIASDGSKPDPDSGFPSNNLAFPKLQFDADNHAAVTVNRTRKTYRMIVLDIKLSF